MARSCIYICLLTVLSLTVGAIWPNGVVAVPAPQFERLGQIRDGLRVPARIAVDAAGNLYVADSRLQHVVKFDRFGRQVAVYDKVKVSGAGLAVNASGSRIIVAAFDQVAVYAGSGELLGYLGQGAGEFGAAGSIDFDSDENIYVADLNLGSIKVFTPELKNSGVLGSVSFVASSDLAVNPATDEIYIAESAVAEGIIPQVRIFDRFGNQLRTIDAESGFGAEPILFFSGMTFDRAGRFYIGDVSGKSVRVLDSSSLTLLNYDQYSISRPSSLAYDAVTGRLYVLRSDYQIDIYGVDGGSNPQQINSAPNAPVPVAPIAGSEVATLTPPLQFRNATDPDEVDEISYTVRIYDAAHQLVSSFDLSEQPLLTTGSSSVSLQENGFYSWQVQAFDGQIVSAWSGLQNFYVNAVNAAPTAPQLLAPLAGAEIGTEGTLSWQGSTDNDPYDQVSYLVEVAVDPAFESKVVSEQSSETELALTEISAGLQPGRSYFWRVLAYDNHAAEQTSTEDGRFTYQASALNITANMPGARVYLGGHQNYAGQFIGEAPLELRDLQPGHYQVVVERAGFESFLLPVEIYQNTISDVYALLQPAMTPAALTFTPLVVAGEQMASGTMLAPLVADLDLDGLEDLLLTSADGTIRYYPGTLSNELELATGEAEKRLVEFVAEQPLELPQLAGATLCLIDWDNDFQQDLLIGAVDGSVRLFLNQGDFRFVGEGQWLAGVIGQAVPTVADIDQDGDKDLVIGSGDGELVLLSNIGSDELPQLAEPKLLVTFSEAAAPSFVDWNADGQRELLIAAEGQVYRAIYAEGALTGLTLVATAGAEVARLSALDLDGVGGKDLIAGTADGKLLLAAAEGDQYVADYYVALQAKLLQIQTQLAEEQPVQLPLVDMMLASLAEGKLADVRVLNEELIFRLSADAAATVMASELAAVLD